MINVNGVFRVLEFEGSNIELKEINGTSVLNFVMVDFFRNEKHDTIYYKAELWGKRAESVVQGLAHKDIVIVNGQEYGKKYSDEGKVHSHIRVDSINKIKVLKMNDSDTGEAEATAEKIKKSTAPLF